MREGGNGAIRYLKLAAEAETTSLLALQSLVGPGPVEMRREWEHVDQAYQPGRYDKIIRRCECQTETVDRKGGPSEHVCRSEAFQISNRCKFPEG